MVYCYLGSSLTVPLYLRPINNLRDGIDIRQIGFSFMSGHAGFYVISNWGYERSRSAFRLCSDSKHEMVLKYSACFPSIMKYEMAEY